MTVIQVNVNRYDLDETFSPPSHDDSFFYIRYPKADASSQKLKEPSFCQANELLHTSKQTPKQDFSQHTIQCRRFIPEEKMDLPAPTGESKLTLLCLHYGPRRCGKRQYFLYYGAPASTITCIVNVGFCFVLAACGCSPHL